MDLDGLGCRRLNRYTMNKIPHYFFLLLLLLLFAQSGSAQVIHKTYSKLFEGAIEDVFVIDTARVIAGGNYFDETVKKIYLDDESRTKTLFEYKTGEIIYNPAGQVLAGVPSSDFSQSIHIVTPEGRLISEVPHQNHIAFSGDGSILFTADFIHIYARDWKSDEIKDSLEWDGQIHNIIPFKQKQLLIEQGGENKSLYLWNYGKDKRPHLFYSTQNAIRKIVPSDNFIVIAENLEKRDYYHRVKVSVLTYEGVVLQEWVKENDIDKITLSSDGSMLALTNRFDDVSLWHRADDEFKKMQAFPEGLNARELQFLNDGSYLMLSNYFELSFFSISNMAVDELIQLDNEATFQGPVKEVGGTKYIIAAFKDVEGQGGLFKIFLDDTDTKSIKSENNKSSESDSAAVVLQSGHLDKISSLVFAGNHTLFSGDESGTLIKWDLNSGLHFEPVSMFENDKVYGSYSGENPLTLAYNSSFGHLAVAADNNPSLPILSAGTMQELFSIPTNDIPEEPAFSTNGRYLAFAEDLDIKIWSASKTGYELLHVVSLDASVNKMLFIQEDSMLAVADVSGRIHIININKGKAVQVLSGHDGGVIDLDYTEKEGWLYSVDFNSNIFRWNLDSFEKEVFYKSSYTDGKIMEMGADSLLVMHLQVDDIQLGRDGKYLYSIGGQFKSTDDLRPIYSILKWDTETANQSDYFDIEEASGIISAMALSPGGEVMTTGGWDQKIRLWDVDKQHWQKSFGNPIPEIEDAIAYRENEIILSTVSSSEGYYRLQKWDLAELQIDNSKNGVIYGTNNLILNQNRNWVGTLFANQLRWVSFDNHADTVGSFRPDKYYSHSHAVPDGELMFAYNITNKKDLPDYNPLKRVNIDVYDTVSGEKVYTLETDGYLNIVEPYSSLQPRFNLKRTLYAIQSGRNKITLFNFKTGKAEKTIETDQMISNAWFSSENLYIWQNNKIIMVNLADYNQSVIHTFNDPVYDPNKNLATAINTSDKTLLAWVSEVKEAVKIGRSRTFNVSLFDADEQIQKKANLPEFPRKLFFLDKGRKLAVVFRAYIALFSTEDLSLICSLVPVKQNDYFFYTPDFFYTSSRDAYRSVGFHFQNQMVSFDQLDLWYNRPDILMNRMDMVEQPKIAVTYEAYVKRLNQSGLTSDSLPDISTWPTVQLEEDITLTSEQDHINFEIQAVDTVTELSSLHVYANGVPVWGQKGKKISGQHHQQSVHVDLTPGNNKIQVSVRNSAGFESLRKTFGVQYEPQHPIKPDLFLVSINISDYQSDNDLEYARKDGEDFVKLFSQNHASLYSNIHIDTLYDEKVKLENILALRQKLLQTKVEDQVILFISGHGLLDDDLEFYFATHDTDFENPSERGISYEKIESLLDGIPARRKLMLIDACHSGEIDRSGLTEVPLSENVTTVYEGTKGVETLSGSNLGLENSFKLMQNLFANLNRGSGTVVISAAAGDSYALESDRWRNGVFTYAVLNGLQEMSADSNNDTRITVSELRNYVYQKVVSETGGRQQPTTRQENLEFDFRIW